MAGIYELSGKIVFFIFLLVLCGNRKHPFNPVQFNKEFVDSVNLGIGMEISTAVKAYTKRDVVTAIKSKSSVSTSIRCVRAIALTRQFLVVNLIVLCNDISTNTGPVANGQICSSCLKSIKQNQARLQCSICRMSFHLKCLDENYELSKTCRLCSTVPNDLVDHCSNNGACFSPKLAEIIKQRGLRIIHQNIRSVTRKIDELRSLVVNAAVEGLWLEILLPKSRGFLLGTFYRPPPPTLCTFMIKILCLSWTACWTLQGFKVKK